MKLNQLRDLEGAIKSKKRVGRGIGSGTGKTCGRGVKGQKSRSGVSLNGFEGGQMPIYRRLPKRGFFNFFSKNYNVVSLGRIQKALDDGKLSADQKITNELLYSVGVFSKVKDGVRLVSDGDLSTKISLEVSGASKAALAKLEKSGSLVSFVGNIKDSN